MDKNPLIELALLEDVGSKDLSGALIDADKEVSAQVITREMGILCGQEMFNAVFHALDKNISITWQVKDGDWLLPNQELCLLKGNARALLTCERTALNFLQTLSGTATLTHEYVLLVTDTGVKILDTRKTIPGLRQLQKYAVRCGGGENQRMGLYDAILIKENHIQAFGSISKVVKKARDLFPNVFLELEVENLAQLEEALLLPLDRILLDNFSLSLLQDAVAITQGKIPLEASGGVNKKNVRDIALTGVNYISIGELTKNIRVLDLSLKIF